MRPTRRQLVALLEEVVVLAVPVRFVDTKRGRAAKVRFDAAWFAAADALRRERAAVEDTESPL